LKFLKALSKNRKNGAWQSFIFAENADENILKKNMTGAGFAEIVGHFFLERNGKLVLMSHKGAITPMQL